MPTGYTAPVVEGKTTTLREFALDCARAFGALVELRDSMDAPIPEEFVVDKHYEERVRTTLDELHALEALTDADVRQQCLREHRAAVASNEKARARQRQENARIDAMVEQVKNWIPPTKDHKELKTFMLDQLVTSRSDYDWPEPALDEPHVWRTKKRDSLLRQLGWATKDRDDEEKRAKERTAWIRALRESL